MPASNRRQFLAQTTLAALTSAVGLRAGLAAGAPAAGPKIRIGQIGVGHAHASKLAVYRASPDYEVVGIVEPDERRRQQAQTQAPYRDLKWMTRDELLSTPGLQAVLVETEVRDLLDNAEACVAAGRHVHIDKPAGQSLTHLRRILEAADRQKLLVQMGYMYRYNPGVVLLREFLKNGWLGDVFEVHTVMSKVVDDASRRALAEYPGGIMFELGCHVIDLVVGVLGAPQSVTAFPQRTGRKPDALIDNMLAVLNYEHATATVKSSALEVDGGERRHLTVCGTGGTLHIQPLDNPKLRVTFSKPQGPYKAGWQDIELPKFSRYIADAADMARIIHGEKPSDFPIAHDLAVQDTVLRACALGPANTR